MGPRASRRRRRLPSFARKAFMSDAGTPYLGMPLMFSATATRLARCENDDDYGYLMPKRWANKRSVRLYADKPMGVHGMHDW